MRRRRASCDEGQAITISCAAEIAIESKLTEIARVLDLIESFAEGHEIAKHAVVAVSVCVDELVSNMIRHGYLGRDAGRIVVALSLEADALCARIEDDGIPFDPARTTPASARSPQESSIGGYGLILVRGLVDEISYCSGAASKANVTTLRKRLDPRRRSTSTRDARASPP